MGDETVLLNPGDKLCFSLRRGGIEAELVTGAERSIAGSLPAHVCAEVCGEPVNYDIDVRTWCGSFGCRLPRLGAPLR